VSAEDNETYLGDAVYASFDGYQIKLRTGDGNAQVIYLEPGVYGALVRFAEALHDGDIPSTPMSPLCAECNHALTLHSSRNNSCCIADCECIKFETPVTEWAR